MGGQRAADEAGMNWDMERVFPGGPGGSAFLDALRGWRAEIAALQTRAEAMAPIAADPAGWSALLADYEAATRRLHEGYTFASCWSSAHTDDADAQAADARVGEAWNQLELLRVAIDGAIAGTEAADLQTLGALRPTIQPYLDDVQRRARLRLPGGQESLATALARDGVEAWDRLYRKISGALRVELTLPGDAAPRSLSAGQAWNLTASRDRATRAVAFRGISAAWAEAAPMCAVALTHIVGARQTLNDRRGVDPLADTLADCRMERATLDAMLLAVRDAQAPLKRYLEQKAALLGLEAPAWYDLMAPIGQLAPHDWATSSRFVVENFRAGLPDLADFADVAFGDAWIEAEDRPGKRQGAWCAWLPLTSQSRIFMTHGGTLRSTITLAHELGHAYHNHLMQDLTPLQRRVPMQLAETASIFAESLVRDAALATADAPATRLALYDARLQAAASFLMNIPARLDFEQRLYTMRREGELTVDALCEQMVDAQATAYGGALSEWNPWFWASKLHFYMGSRAFYNFPYTFGYLFAGLVYERARTEGPGFRDTLAEILRRSAWERAEPMVQEILGLDLTDPDTWRLALAGLEPDLAGFEAAALAACAPRGAQSPS